MINKIHFIESQVQIMSPVVEKDHMDMKWYFLTAAFIVFTSSLNFTASSSLNFISSFKEAVENNLSNEGNECDFRDVPEFRKCELMASEEECSLVFEAIKTLIFSSDLEEGYRAVQMIRDLSFEAKNLIYKPWYFTDDKTGNKILFFGIIEIFKWTKNPHILIALRCAMNSYQASKIEFSDFDPDFELDSIETLKGKLGVIFQKRLHDLIFTNPNKTTWSRRPLNAIAFYSSTFEVPEIGNESEIRTILRALWFEAQNTSIESVASSSKYNFYNSKTAKIVNEFKVSKSNELSLEDIRNLSGSFSVIIDELECEEVEDEIRI